MGESVEARSLAALNQLAANPPKYPTRPHETKQDPLTLYISRVPGTRDVILSTLKPQVKNVTAGDVASSLYYIHYQTAKDESLAALKQQASTPRSSTDNPRQQIHRKPVPASSTQAASGAPVAPAAPSGKENQGFVDSPARKPLQGTAPGESSERRPSTPTASGYRSPLSPRSPADKSRQKAQPMSNACLSPFSNDPHQVGDPAPLLPPRPGTRRAHSDTGNQAFATPDTAFNSYNSFNSPSTKKHSFTPFSLTVIRRDPSSGQQWNIARIASFQLENADYMEDERRHQASPSIQIQIESSGYAKFRGMPMELSLPPGLDLRPGSASSGSRLQQSHEILANIPTSGIFERQVKMTYSPSFTASLRQQFRRRSSIDEGHSASPHRHTSGHSRENSGISITSIAAGPQEHDGTDHPIITQPAPGLKARGYMFYSPWNGRCEFMTGNAGRSLKCRHVLPSYGGGVYNPLVEGSNGEHGDERPDSTRPVSELRFNLPRNEMMADKRSGEGGMRARDQIQSQFNKMMAMAQGLEDSDDGEFHFDLTIGREKAGGGNRGKRAKMGKLIIYDEGLKMLDLTVAANVGIWWTTWERTFEQ